ncbi:MAG: carboxypeptidase-like regulatory domain-containing protein [Planctomycetia bacterium]
MNIRRFACWTMGLALTAGCSGGPAMPKTAPVKGVVKKDGKPIANAAIVYYPESGGRAASGNTDAAGAFTLSTFKPNDGALLGPHVVAVVANGAVAGSESDNINVKVAPPPKDPSTALQPNSEIPLKYAEMRTSDLKQTVADGPNDHAIELK